MNPATAPKNKYLLISSLIGITIRSPVIAIPRKIQSTIGKPCFITCCSFVQENLAKIKSNNNPILALNTAKPIAIIKLRANIQNSSLKAIPSSIEDIIAVKPAII